MAILEKHNENARRQAVAGYNVNVTSDNNISIVPNLSNSIYLSQQSRSRFSSNYSEFAEKEGKETNEDSQMEDTNFNENIDEEVEETLRKDDKFKRNTFSTISSIDPASTKLFETLKLKTHRTTLKSPKKNYVGFKIPENLEEEEKSEDEERGKAEPEVNKKLSISWKNLKRVESGHFSNRIKKQKAKLTYENNSSSGSEESSNESGIESKTSNLVMDSVRIFKVYFPHNNVNEIFETMKYFEKIKQKRFQRKKNTTEFSNKTFWNLFGYKSPVGLTKKVKQFQKSLIEENSKVDTKKDKESTKVKTNESNIINTRRTDEADKEAIQKKILRKIRDSDTKKDSILHQILKSKQK